MTGKTLLGKTIVVTGAGRGLGRAMAYALAKAGGTVVVVDIDADALGETYAQCPSGARLETVQIDLTDELRVELLAEELNTRFGGVDTVFANAGILLVKPSLELSSAEFSRVLDVNVLATFATARAFARHMLDGGGGKLILTTSTLGDRGLAKWTTYCASKAAVTSMTQSLAAEWGPLVTVNAIAPGAAVTHLNQHVLDDPAYMTALKQATAKGRLIEPEDVGPLAVFLAGPGSDMISGEVITIDGGRA